MGYSPWGKSRMNKHSTYMLFNVIIHLFLRNFQTIPNENEFLRKQFSLVDLDITFIYNRFLKMNEEIITGKMKRWREGTRKEEEGQKEGRVENGSRQIPLEKLKASDEQLHFPCL